PTSCANTPPVLGTSSPKPSRLPSANLCFDLLPGDRLVRLAHGHVSLGGVFGVLGSAESLDHRFRNDRGHALTVNSEMGDDATPRHAHPPAQRLGCRRADRMRTR